jgi:hypothetical protein
MILKMERVTPTATARDPEVVDRVPDPIDDSNTTDEKPVATGAAEHDPSATIRPEQTRADGSVSTAYHTDPKGVTKDFPARPYAGRVHDNRSADIFGGSPPHNIEAERIADKANPAVIDALAEKFSAAIGKQPNVSHGEILSACLIVMQNVLISISDHETRRLSGQQVKRMLPDIIADAMKQGAWRHAGHPQHH